MRIEYFKAYNEIHTWTGIVAGLFLFICFVTGAFTMLKTPLNQWSLQSQSTLPSIERSQYDELIQQVYRLYPEAKAEMMVYLPDAFPRNAPVTWTIEDVKTHKVTAWHASFDSNGALIAEPVSVSAIGDFFDHLHRTAGIPGGDGHDAIGTYFMGVVAAVYFAALVSGLIIFLPNWYKDLLALRNGSNRKRYWMDFHNVLGLTALPFHLIIALTTVVFAYHDLIYDSLQRWVYKETPMFDRPAPNQSSNASDLASLDDFERAIRQLEPDFQLTELRLAGIDTPRAMAITGGQLQGQWIRGPELAYVVSNPYTAEPGYTAMLPSGSGFMGKIVNGLFTLHFGGFGGDTIKWIYVGLGLSGSLVFFTGNLLWLESRRKRQKQICVKVSQSRSAVIMARLTIGTCLGTLMGIVLTLLTVFWLPHHHYQIEFWQQVAYYTGFGFCIFGALFVQPMKAARNQLRCLCVLVVALWASNLTRLFTDVTQPVDVGFGFVSLLASVMLLALLIRLERRIPHIAPGSVWSLHNQQKINSPIKNAVNIYD